MVWHAAVRWERCTQASRVLSSGGAHERTTLRARQFSRAATTTLFVLGMKTESIDRERKRTVEF